MADEEDESTASETETDQSTEGSKEGAKPSDTVEYWKRKSRENETRAKSNASAAQKLKEIEDSNKSESDKLTDRVTAAERRAEAAELKSLRLEVAAQKGLTPQLAKRLQGSTLTELEEDADDLLASFPADKHDSKTETKQTSNGQTRKPKESLRGGADPEAEPEEEDPAKLAASIIGARGY